MQLLSHKRIFIKIQDGGCRHLEFIKTVAISFLLNRYAQNLVGMLQILYSTHCFVKKRTFNKSQDGGCRHLEFRKTVAIALLLDQSSQNLIGILQIHYRTQPSCLTCSFNKIQDGDCRHLELPFLYFYTNQTLVYRPSSFVSL